MSNILTTPYKQEEPEPFKYSIKSTSNKRITHPDEYKKQMEWTPSGVIPSKPYPPSPYSTRFSLTSRSRKILDLAQNNRRMSAKPPSENGMNI